MAQSGYSKILIYGSGTTGNTPSASNMTNSSAGAELAINYADGILFYKNGSGTVTKLATASTAAGNLPGGTAGVIPYQSAAGTTSFTAAGASGQYLISGGTGSPTWATISSTLVSSFSGGSTGLTPATATSGAITLGGTLATSNGGTGLTGFTAANNALYSTSSSVLVAGTLPVAAGGSGVTVSSGANSIVLRDANVNVSANSFLTGFNSTAAGGSTVVLTAASAPYQLITGSGNQTFQLPDATTLSLGTTFSFNNNSSSGSVSINNNSSTLVASVGSGGYINVELLTNSNAAGTWDKHYQAPSNVSWTTSSLTYNGTYTGGGTWNGNAIGVAYGGTGLTSLTAGSLVYGNGTSAMNTLPIGTAGQVLTVNPGGTAPIWSSIGSSVVTTFSGGTTGLTPSTPSTGAITLGGTLATANGGTGLTTFTSGGAVYATSTSALTTGILPIASGGTNSSATPTLGGVAYGTGSAIAVTAVGTTGQVLISNAGSAPSWGSVGIANGGTGASTASAGFNALSPIANTGDLIIGNGSNSATRLGIGLNGYVLTSNGTTASWQAATASGVSSFSAGTTGLTPNSATTGAIVLGGTLAIANGGTGATTASAAFNALSPITSVGDLIIGTGVNTGSRLAIGTNGYVLTSNGTTASWAANTGTFSSVTITGGTINGTSVGATTASTGAFTTLSASSTVSGTGFSTYLASPPAIGGTAANTGTFTTIALGGNTQNQKLGAGDASIIKNRIINGAMVIDQRNAGASVATSAGSTIYTVDRFQATFSQISKYTIQQNAGSVTPPVGFTNYLGVTSSSAYTVGASEQFTIRQYIEGYNIADLAWGTANAKTVTLSFWVYSSLTGTFGGALTGYSNTYSYPFSYSIPVANTWTQISITIAGATSTTWNTTNSGGIALILSLGAGATVSGTAGSWSANTYYSATGATSVVGTNGATFYITGVQLEVGSSATGFEYRQYGQELALCQRYFYNMSFPQSQLSGPYSLLPCGANQNTTNTINFLQLPVSMRTSPSLTWSGPWEDLITGASGTTVTLNGQGQTPQSVFLNFIPSTGAFVTGGVNACRINNSNTWYGWLSAEL